MKKVREEITREEITPEEITREEIITAEPGGRQTLAPNPGDGARFRGLPNLDEPMSAPVYALRFLTLMALHYAGTVLLLWHWGKRIWSPLEYLSPFLTHRMAWLEESVHVATLGLWTLPFLGLAAVWSIQRARDAGLPVILVFFLLVPGVNYFLVIGLCLSPKEVEPLAEETVAEREEKADKPGRFAQAPQAVVAGAMAGGLILVVSFLALSSPYGAALFVGAPVAVGLVSSVVYNRQADRGTASSQLVAQVSLFASSGLLLLFGIEGGLCLVMMLPLAMPLAAMGSWIGDALAEPGHLETYHVVLLVLASPFLTAFDSAAPGPPLRAITTQVEIDAPPASVWPNVVAFTELPPPHELSFRLGIAYPMRARIEGHGVGAVRYCEFSTGAFVEPITHWEEPRRLAFDVVEQPPTMHEWSPYQIDPKHLTESLRSERGEFRLTALPGGRTRLEGTTWYRHDLMPQLYWNLWSDELIHGIHRRVLDHIKARSEADERG